jgi:hypothetical protein
VIDADGIKRGINMSSEERVIWCRLFNRSFSVTWLTLHNLGNPELDFTARTTNSPESFVTHGSLANLSAYTTQARSVREASSERESSYYCPSFFDRLTFALPFSSLFIAPINLVEPVLKAKLGAPPPI